MRKILRNGLAVATMSGGMVLLGHAVARKLGVAGEREVFLDDLLGGAADLAFGAGAVEDAVDDIAKRALAAGLVTRTGFG